MLNGFEPKLSPNAFLKHPVFSITDAAVNKTVYSMPLGGYRWDPPNQESPLTWMWVGMLSYSNAHKYDLKKEIDVLIKKLQPLGLASASRTGVVAMTKGSEIYK